MDAAELLPGVEGAGVFDPDDAVVDPHALLAIFLQRARDRGVSVRFGQRVTGIEVREGRVVSVRTADSELDASAVVVASGAWAGEVAGLAGSRSVPIEARRRHLFRATLTSPRAPTPFVPTQFVWDEESGVYFKPEGDRWLVSPCDATPHPAGVPEVDAEKQELVAAKLERRFGALGDWAVGPGWACLRTFAPDERPVIGPDACVRGLFWVAGLGGHGVTASWAVGRFAAEVFLGVRAPGPFDPYRFVSEGRFVSVGRLVV